MADAIQFQEPKAGPGRYVLWAALALALLGAAYFIYLQATSVPGVAVDAPPVQSVEMLPPPPPPPPPPPEPQTKPPEPTDKPTPTPTPAPAPDAPAPMTIAGPAQAGADAYGMQSGTGGGMGAPGGTGTCLKPPCGPTGVFSDAFYRRGLSSALQSYIDRDRSVNRETFTADLLITVNASGAITAVQMVRASGKSKVDTQLTAILQNIRGLDTPPAGVRFPQKITVRGRRAL